MSTAAIVRYYWLRGQDNLDDFQKKYLWWVMGGSALVITLALVGVLFNQEVGFFRREWNIALAYLAIVAWGMTVFNPKAIFWLFGIGAVPTAVDGEPDTVGSAAHKAARVVKKYISIVSIAAVLFVCYFGVLAIVPLSQPWMAMAFLAFLAGAGIWMFAYKEDTSLLKRWTYRILMAGILITVFASILIVVRPQDRAIDQATSNLQVRLDEGQEARAEMLADKASAGTLSPAERRELQRLAQSKGDRTGARGLFNWVYDKTLSEVSLASAKPQMLSGLVPGQNLCTVPAVNAVIDGTPYWVHHYVRLDGVDPQKETVLVLPDGQAQFSLAFNQQGLASARFAPVQKVQIICESGIAARTKAWFQETF